MAYWQSGHSLQKGKYIIEEILGSGGFGVTYRAKDTRSRQRVAIKTMLRSRFQVFKNRNFSGSGGQDILIKAGNRDDLPAHPTTIDLRSLMIDFSLKSTIPLSQAMRRNAEKIP